MFAIIVGVPGETSSPRKGRLCLIQLPNPLVFTEQNQYMCCLRITGFPRSNPYKFSFPNYKFADSYLLLTVQMVPDLRWFNSQVFLLYGACASNTHSAETMPTCCILIFSQAPGWGVIASRCWAVAGRPGSQAGGRQGKQPILCRVLCGQRSGGIGS